MDLLASIPACASDVHPKTMLRLARAESAQQPLAIHVNGARLQRQPRTLAEAVVTARWLRAQGYAFDAGAWQINVRNWPALGLDERTVFDACRNAAAAQAVLIDCFRRAPGRDPQTALRQALSCYNAGNFKGGFSNGYVSRVVGAPVAAMPTVPSPQESP